MGFIILQQKGSKPLIYLIRKTKHITAATPFNSYIFEQAGELALLASTLSYQGFLYIQYKKGNKAFMPIKRALQLNQTLGTTRRGLRFKFLLAFANLDQGINGAEGTRLERLDAAKSIFGEVIRASDQLNQSPILAASYALPGWTLSEKGEHERAIEMISVGKKLYHNLRLYLARAHYELWDYQEAYRLAQLAKTEFPDEWDSSDEERFRFYGKMQNAKIHAMLSPEKSAHSRYCESI